MNMNKGANALGKWAAIVMGFSIPISTAFDNILLLLVLLSLLFSGNYRRKLGTITANPVARASLLLVAALLLGGLYGGAEFADVLHYWRKYAHLLLIVLLVPLFVDKPSREYAITGFMLAMAVTLALSYLTASGWLPANKIIGGSTGNPFVFKMHITQNVFMAFFAYLLAVNSFTTSLPWKRAAFGLAAILAAYNVLFMVQGRTGYVVLAVLLTYLCFRWLRWKGIAIAVLAGMTVAAAGYYGSHMLRDRVNLVVTELAAWQAGNGSGTSSGLRMDYYTNSLKIIADHPVLGVGTGGFEKAYAAKVKGTEMAPSNNPHNQYLLVTAQLGMIGLAVLLYLFYTQWRAALLLPSEFEQIVARGMLLTIMSGSLLNSLLLDHSEGFFFSWMSGVLFAGLNAARQRNGSNA